MSSTGIGGAPSGRSRELSQPGQFCGPEVGRNPPRMVIRFGRAGSPAMELQGYCIVSFCWIGLERELAPQEGSEIGDWKDGRSEKERS